MTRASDLSRQIMRITQSKGKAEETGPGLFNVIAAAKKENKIGRPKREARLGMRSRKTKAIAGKRRMKEEDWRLAAELWGTVRPSDPEKADVLRQELLIEHLSAVEAMVRAK